MLHSLTRKSSTPLLAGESAEARDERLLQGLRAGEPRALEEAFYAYHEGLYAFAYRYTRVRETAEELIQQVFLRVWERREQMVGTERLRPFLFGAVRNAALSHLRHERVERKLAASLTVGMVGRGGKGVSNGEGGVAATRASDIPGMSQFASEIADGQTTQDAHALTDELRDAVELLPPRTRQAITLRWQRQMRNAEIAEVMGISVQAVEFSIVRALNHLRRILEPRH